MAIKRVGKGFEFAETHRRFQQFKQDAPKEGGGQTDDSKGGWAPRLSNAKRNTGRAILVDTGALRRSIGVIKATFKEIVIASTGIPYAKRHNEGLSKMPQREFIGDSKEMNEKNKKLLVKLLGKVFKG
jgi:phage gpG-like protein